MTSTFGWRCPSCGATDEHGRFCSNCGQPAPAPVTIAPTRVQPAASPEPWTVGQKILAAIATGLVCFLGVIVLAALNSHSAPASASARRTPSPEPTDWWPSDFEPWPGDSSIAWRFEDRGEFNCTYSGASCWGMDVIARDGCSSSLYVELTILDSSGAAIGYTNDAAGRLISGQHAKLVFNTFEASAEKARISTINCY